MNSSDENCIDVDATVAVVADAARAGTFVVGLLSTVCVAIFRIHFDDAVALNIDVPSNVDGFDAAATLVRAELATNIVALGVDCMTTVTMMMTASLLTTFDCGNSIEKSAMRFRKKTQTNEHQTYYGF